MVPVLLTSCIPSPTPIPDFITTEEYQVYHDLLLENPDMWNVPPGAQHMIIFNQSYVRPETQVVSSLLQNKDGVSEQLIANFLQANQKPYFFEDQFNLGIPVTFVSDESIQNLVWGLRFAEQCQQSIEAIYPWPEYGGFYYLSRVGFDAKMKVALLYIEKSICGGNGGFLIFQKEAETWKIIDFATALNSDLGLAMPERLAEEEQAVLNTALQASSELLLDEGYQYLTVYDQTGLTDQLLLDGGELFSVINAKLPGVTEDMLNNLITQNAEPHYLVPNFSLDVPVVLISWQEYWQLSQGVDEDTSLATLLERFPEPIFQGWLRISRVGFNQEMTKALVYVDSFRCKREGFLFIFEKQRYDWKLIDHISLSTLPNDQYFGRILFESNRDGNQDLYMMNPDGTDPLNLTNNPTIDFSASWSPDWNAIAYNSGIDGNAEIFTLQLDTLAVQRLTSTDAYDRQPAWSPDGNQIAFTSDKDGDWEIYLMDKDGKNVIQLTNNELFDLAPEWSPDGKKLAYASQQEGNWDLFLIDLYTKQVKRLTDHPANDLNPVWSPDGEKIAFQSDRDGNLEIYIMNTDGSELTNVSNHPADDYNPDW